MKENLITEFYQRLIFGNKNEDLLLKSIKKAYQDFCRTLTGFGQSSNKVAVKNKLEKLLYNDIKEMINNKYDIKLYDNWHRNLYEKISNEFGEYEYYDNKKNTKIKRAITCGQIQKWINMTLKYYATLDRNALKEVYPYLHIPIDNDILESVDNYIKESIFKYDKWSQITEYDDYLEFQERFREASKKLNKVPLDYECELWARK